MVIIKFVLSAVLLLVVHEAGHYVTAYAFRKRPKLVFNPFAKFGKTHLGVTWDESPEWINRYIGEAGFGATLGLSAVMVLSGFNSILNEFLLIQAVHFWVYPWAMRHSNFNDFNHLKSKEEHSHV